MWFFVRFKGNDVAHPGLTMSCLQTSSRHRDLTSLHDIAKGTLPEVFQEKVKSEYDGCEVLVLLVDSRRGDRQEGQEPVLHIRRVELYQYEALVLEQPL